MKSDTHIMAAVMPVIIAAFLVTAFICLFSPRLRPRFLKIIAILLGGTIALYLVGRGIAEFWLVDYSNPASYQHAWGGPSLIGVFVVHSGPGLAILIAGAAYLFTRLKKRRQISAGTTSKQPSKKF